MNYVMCVSVVDKSANAVVNVYIIECIVDLGDVCKFYLIMEVNTRTLCSLKY